MFSISKVSRSVVTGVLLLLGMSLAGTSVYAGSMIDKIHFIIPGGTPGESASTA